MNLEAEPASQPRDSRRYDARRQTKLRTGQTVDRRDPARVEGVEHLEIQVEVPALAEREPFGRLDGDNLDRRCRVLPVLTHPQRDRTLPQHGSRRGELLRALL